MENSKAYIKFIISLLIFGSNGLVASLIDLSSHQIVLLRTLIGGIFLSAILLYQKKPLAALKNKRHFFFVVMSGVSMGISWLFLYEAYNCSGVSLATLIYYCGPVLVMILSPVLFKESFTPAKIFGFTAVLLGMLCVNFNSLTGEGFSKGILYSSLGAVFFALMTVLNKKGSSITGIENSAVSILSSCATAAVFTAVRYGLSFEIPVNSIAPIIFIGIINTGLGCYLYFSSMSSLPAQTVSVCGYLEPLSALVFSALFLHETLSHLQLFGAFLIIGGAAFGEVMKDRVHVDYVTIKIPLPHIAKIH